MSAGDKPIVAGEELHYGDLVVIRDGVAFKALRGDKPDGVWARNEILTSYTPPQPGSFTTLKIGP